MSQAAARFGDPISHSFSAEGQIAGEVGATLAISLLFPPAEAAEDAAVAVVGIRGAVRWLATKAATAAQSYVEKIPQKLATKAVEAAGGKLGDLEHGATGKIAEGSLNVRTNQLFAAHVGDRVTCDSSTIKEGSRVVSINQKPASRVGDGTKCGGTISEGSDNVFMGGPPSESTGKDTEHENKIESLAGSTVSAVIEGVAAGKTGAALVKAVVTKVAKGAAIKEGTSQLGKLAGPH
jgi:uncharacterized Zn-binding protein involved in type VI secretion